MEWWQLTSEQIESDPAAKLQRQVAYHNTFYGADDGREVLVDLMQICYAVSSDPVAMLARIELFTRIKALAGVNVDVDKAAIDAEADSIVFEQEAANASNTE